MGTIVNVILILIGGIIGIFAKKLLNDRLHESIMSVMGLCVLIVGLQGALKTINALIVIVSLVIGTIIGEVIDIDKHINNLSCAIESKYFKQEGSFAKGFMTASCLYVIGAMAIFGSIQSGLGNHSILYTKGLIDGVTSVFLSSIYGIGVLFSVVPVFIYQGLITIASTWLMPYLTDILINEMTAVGSIMIMAIAFNLLGVTKIKVANLLPSIVVVIILMLIIV